MTPELRAASASDQPFLVDMAVEAVNWAEGRHRSREAVLADPELAHYVSGWPGTGELGVVAEAEGEPVGAAWLRFFTSDDPGFGYVADDIPEFSIAVVREWRGRGIGRALLKEMAARARWAGVARISVSVERANFARNLYADEGFVVVNRDTDADTMVLDL